MPYWDKNVNMSAKLYTLSCSWRIQHNPLSPTDTNTHRHFPFSPTHTDMPSAAHAQSRVHTRTLTPHKHTHALSHQKRLISLQELSTASRETKLKIQKQAALDRLARHICVRIQAAGALKGGGCAGRTGAAA